MANTTTRTLAGIIRLALAATFIIKGLPKVLAANTEVLEFERFRYPGWFRVAVGVIEIVGATLLLSKRTTELAATLLAAIMVGAASTLINVGDFRQSFIPMFVLGLLGYVAWHNRAR